MAVPYKSKPNHEKIIIQFATEIRNNPALMEFSNQIDMSSIVPSNEVAEGKTGMEKTSLQFS